MPNIFETHKRWRRKRRTTYSIVLISWAVMPLSSTLRVRTSAVACSTFDVSFHHLDEHPQTRSHQAVLDELRSNRWLVTPLVYLRSTGEENPPRCVRISVRSGWSPYTPQRCSTLQGQARHTTVQSMLLPPCKTSPFRVPGIAKLMQFRLKERL